MSEFYGKDELTFDAVAADANDIHRRLTEEANVIKEREAQERMNEARRKYAQAEAEERRREKEFLARVQRKMHGITGPGNKPELLIERHLPEKTLEKFAGNFTLCGLFTIKIECTWGDCKAVFDFDYHNRKRRRCDNCAHFCVQCKRWHNDSYYEKCETCDPRPQNCYQ